VKQKTLKLAALILCCAGMMLAGPITYTESATASGSLGGSSFTNALVTVKLDGDTANVVSGGGGFFTNSVGTFTVNVVGIGTAALTAPGAEVFVNQTFAPAAAGFGAGSSILDTLNSSLSTYALTTAIGPITGSPFINPGTPFSTSLGNLVINSAGNSTFTATTNASIATPEPMTGGMLCVGLLGLLGLGRLRGSTKQ